MTREDKLFHASVAAMQGLLATDMKMFDAETGNFVRYMTFKDCSKISVLHAESLLAELDKEGGE